MSFILTLLYITYVLTDLGNSSLAFQKPKIMVKSKEAIRINEIGKKMGQKDEHYF